MMRSMMVLVAVAGGCVAEVGDEATSSVEQGLKCPDFGCGENSPLLGPFNIRELDKTGSPNAEGVSVAGFVKGGTTYHLDVVNGRLRAWKLTFVGGWVFNTVLEHQQLVGGSLRLTYPENGDLHAGTVDVRVETVDEMSLKFWQGPADPVETYELTYSLPELTFGSPTPVCKNPLAIRPGLASTTKPALDGEKHVWPDRFSAIFFTGDLYKTDYTVRIPTGPDAVNVFNIACAGSAPAKLHLNRHTSASAVPGFTTTQPQRQAMFKMYGGDFCGDGLHFTVQGTPIHWASSTGLSSPAGNETTVESLWDDQGAVCMSTHRLQDSTSYAGFAYLIRHHCDMPLCPTAPDVATSGQYILTRSPATAAPFPYTPPTP